MGNPRPTPALQNLKPAKKGEVKSPNGKNGNDVALNGMKRFGRKEFVKILDLVLTSNIKELQATASDDTRSALTRGIARALFHAVNKGDWEILEKIAERIVGKNPLRIDHTSAGKGISDPDAARKVILYLPKNGRTKEENEDGFDLGF